MNNESLRLRKKYPHRIPVIAKLAPKSKLPFLDKNKYLVPDDLTIGQFMYVIRKRIKLNPEDAMFFFLEKNVLPPTSAMFVDIYAKHKNTDGFLYLTILEESTFGSHK